MVREHDCGTLYFEDVQRNEKQSIFGDSFESRIFGRFTAKDVVDETGKIVVKAGTLLTKKVVRDIMDSTASVVPVRSVLMCETEG